MDHSKLSATWRPGEEVSKVDKWLENKRARTGVIVPRDNRLKGDSQCSRR